MSSWFLYSYKRGLLDFVDCKFCYYRHFNCRTGTVIRKYNNFFTSLSGFRDLFLNGSKCDAEYNSAICAGQWK